MKVIAAEHWLISVSEDHSTRLIGVTWKKSKTKAGEMAQSMCKDE